LKGLTTRPRAKPDCVDPGEGETVKDIRASGLRRKSHGIESSDVEYSRIEGMRRVLHHASLSDRAGLDRLFLDAARNDAVPGPDQDQADQLCDVEHFGMAEARGAAADAR